MAFTRAKLPSVLAVAYVVGIILLRTGSWSAYAAPLVIHSESYIVRYQNATCDSTGRLVFLGTDSPIVLSSAPALQVQTSTVSSVRYQDIWNQNLITDNRPRYQVLQNGEGEEPSQNCMFVDADASAGSILTVDVCSSSSTTFQQFEYSLVTSASGCESGNENGYAVQIKPAAVVDIGGDLCFSASSSAGVTVSLQTCNSADESQLFFINVPSITTQP
ncbi:hypothetical protein Mapa_008863 [Marchantia paleacea]|nr:hypothetical protein Mapa_008863 [Marchantia paleacea]